jgi:hypothetical protein
MFPIYMCVCVCVCYFHISQNLVSVISRTCTWFGNQNGFQVSGDFYRDASMNECTLEWMTHIAFLKYVIKKHDFLQDIHNYY